ncbi:hypothetical protein LV89_01893 [Arcicella aurantiaca]|uniref:Uncharacterized protein n=1 Tax=Arcicella aurantiaca TaxID=591202 RepID=A0A316EEI5_9BACT|nr:glucoamylase family protein [Arcicella aurantiaca]PWK27079.1 hypothetical protein LV89_01893 [Arcicella aurantiaca]
MKFFKYFAFCFIVMSCKSGDNKQVVPPSLELINSAVDNHSLQPFYEINYRPNIQLIFNSKLNRDFVPKNIILADSQTSDIISVDVEYAQNDSAVILKPKTPLKSLSKYTVEIYKELKSQNGSFLSKDERVTFITAMDSTDKFVKISDEQLLDLVQKQTFKYFWDFGHPVSGLSRERNSSGETVTSGGSGFGVMAILVGIERKFISREEGLARIDKIVDFLKDKTQKYHGAFPHWLNGSTGATIAFSQKDNGADLVETSYLLQGLLTARQYFSNNTPKELELKSKINTIWNNVEWSWFRKNNEKTLYWHWSPNFNWDMNMPISGYNEALITYILAASSPTFAIPKEVYENGWAKNGAIKNGNTYFGVKLPVGFAYGGPLFFAHYSFLGLDPNGLQDSYANYLEQNIAHSKINFLYCKNNSKRHNGYSENCWGLTASDEYNGYSAHEPNNDNGTISPTAALSSLPFTPIESMQALRFFYFKLGDKLWKNYGFVDAFNLNRPWFADSFLAIDQGPEIIMIENYRSQMLWKLFMSCPEVKNGLKQLEFSSPYL